MAVVARVGTEVAGVWSDDSSEEEAGFSREGSVHRVSLVNLLYQKGLFVLRDVKTFHSAGSEEGSIDWLLLSPGDMADASLGTAEKRFALTDCERSLETLLDISPGSGVCHAGTSRATSRSFARRASPTPSVCSESSDMTFSEIRRDTSARSRVLLRSISDRRPATLVSTVIRRALALAPGSKESKSRRSSFASCLTSGGATVLTGSNMYRMLRLPHRL
mmetsp:Transcript_32716/g.63936  ORF Transcript_32716/g.63936 Transcript_32716/m.63936 type:complete len:219 (+) Transcript_32716:139-795(+)